MEVARQSAKTSQAASEAEHATECSTVVNNEDHVLRLRVRRNTHGLTELDLSRQDLRELPSEVFNFTRIEVLFISRNHLQRIGPRVGQLRRMKALYAGHNQLSTLPETLANCSHLQELDLNCNQLTDLPPSLGQLKNLKLLKLSHNRFEQLPNCVGNIESLRRLEAIGNRLWGLPFTARSLKQLKQLNIAHNDFTSLPPLICHLRTLEALNVKGNRLSDLPADFNQLRSLKELNLAKNRLEVVPEVILSLRSLTQLNLASNRLNHAPYKLSRLPRLSALYLQDNRLLAFSADGPGLKQLSLANNRIRAMSVEKMPALRSLNASGNCLEALPLGLFEASHLEKLMLQRNALQHLPAEVAQLKHLRHLDVSFNQLTDIPHALNELVHLESLNIDGNPIVSRPTMLRGTDPLETIRTTRSGTSRHRRHRDASGERQSILATKILPLQPSNGNIFMYAPASAEKNDDTFQAQLQDFKDGSPRYSGRAAKAEEEEEEESEEVEHEEILAGGQLLPANPIRVDYKLLGLCNQVENLLTKSWMNGAGARGVKCVRNGQKEEEEEKEEAEEWCDEWPHPDLFPAVKPTGHFLQTQPDLFVVGPSGGLFASSIDPNVKLYFPVNCVLENLQVAMQMETFDKELVQELRLRSEVVDNILSIGQIVHLTVLEPPNPTFLTQITLTIPAPPCPREQLRTGKLHLLSFKTDGSCLPCTSSFTISSGYITLQTWNLVGKGGLVTKAKCRYKACKAVENLMRLANFP